MRKLLVKVGLLALLFLGLGVMSVNAQCWIEPEVTWSGSCVTIDDNTFYQVTLTVVDVCNGGTVLFNETQNLENTLTSTSFCIEEELCKADMEEPCFMVIATVQKRYAFFPYSVVCEGSYTVTLNCEDLMNLTNIAVTLS